MRIFGSFFACILLHLCSGVGHAADAPTVTELFSNPAFSNPRVSPDGKYLAVAVCQGDQQFVAIRPVTGGSITPIAKLDDPRHRLSWIEWANDDRLLISANSRAGGAVGVVARRTQLFSVPREGGKLEWLGRDWPAYWAGRWRFSEQFEDRIIHWLPDDPNHVLILNRDPRFGDTQVNVMDVASGKLALVQESVEGVDIWHADRRGQVRVGEGYEDGRYQLWARLEEGRPFKRVWSHEVFESNGIGFVAFHADPAKIYVAAPYEDRIAFFEFDLGSGELGELVFSHPQVDAGELIVDPLTQQVLGARYTVDVETAEYFDTGAAAEHQVLIREFRSQFGPNVTYRVVSRTRDRAVKILRVSADTQPPVYYLYDKGRNGLGRLIDERPALKGRPLAATRRENYTARDGRAIPAYLTLPPGSEGRKLPTIVLPHGGPWARDSITWNPELQLFASRGFAVLQVNFRGSTGFGSDHLQAGYREWGQKIQDDITDGVEWLIEQGVADPERIGIYGASFGGYAALVGAVKTPKLYRAVAAYAAVTDIEDMLEEGGTADRELQLQLVGGGVRDLERLRENSPLRRTAEITVPVLLGHGEHDDVVNVTQSQRMAKALKRAKKDYDYLEFANEVHGFLLEANRIEWYETLVEFFEEHLTRQSKGPDKQPTG